MVSSFWTEIWEGPNEVDFWGRPHVVSDTSLSLDFIAVNSEENVLT